MSEDDIPCYLCRDVYDSYTKHDTPSVEYIQRFFADFKEDSALCESCHPIFLEIYNYENGPILDETLPAFLPDDNDEDEEHEKMAVELRKYF